MTSSEKNQPDHQSEEDLEPVSTYVSSDRRVIMALVFLVLFLMVARWIYLSGFGLKPVEVKQATPVELQYQIEINQATWIEWIQLEGVGETLARKIIEYREKNGPFESIEDLLEIDGIGEKTLDKFRPWIRLEKPDNSNPNPNSQSTAP